MILVLTPSMIKVNAKRKKTNSSSFVSQFSVQNIRYLSLRYLDYIYNCGRT
jgi:hypothetical protein